MRVLVAGSSGVIGSALVEQLLAAGHDVGALSRSRGRAHSAFRLGAEPIVCNALDAPALAAAVARFRPEVLVNELTSIPKQIHPRRIRKQMAATNRLRREGTANLVAAARRSGVRRIVQQSVAFMYAPSSDPVDEQASLYLDAPDAFRDVVQAVSAGEQTVLEAAPLETVVLRYGFLYGPGTAYAPGGSVARQAVRARLPVIGTGDGRLSFVHVSDAAAATVAALGTSATGIYNVVDDEPVAAARWLAEYAAMLDAPAPLQVPRLLGRLFGGAYGVYLATQLPGASNARARALLGWAPRYAGWHSGFREMLSSR